MKALYPYFSKIIFVSILLFLSGSCKKESTINFTEDDAADAIANSIESNSGGTAGDISSAAGFAIKSGYGKRLAEWGLSSLQCGVPFDTSISFVKTGVVTANVIYNWDVLLNCNGGNPFSLTWTGTYQGSFDAPRLSGNISGVRNWTLTNIDGSSNTFTLNGNTTRTGIHNSKVGNKYTYDVNIKNNFVNLSIDKDTRYITGGTGTVSATLNVSNGTSKSYNGTIVFNGNKTATLTINGKTYTIYLY